MPYELVIFDCDGVLVDSETLTVAIEARVLTEMGWPMTAEDVVREFMGRSSETILAEIEQRIGREATLEFDRVSTAEVIHAFETRLQPIAGVETLVRHLIEVSVATCVASSGSHRKMRKTLGVTGLWELFEGRIFSAHDVERGKPEPDLFLHAAMRMGADPVNCAVVEDSVYGVQAAIAAGMTAFGYGGGLTDADTLARHGAIVFGHMSELGDLLGTPIGERTES